MQKRALIVPVLLFFLSIRLFAGDIAAFENLGFSEDAKLFLFAQYGIGAEDSRAYAELYMVDMAGNRFLSGGVLKKSYDEEIYPGQNGSGALYMALREFTPRIEKEKINHLATGRLVYLLINGDTPQKHLEFRDFLRGEQFEVELIQHSYGEGKDVSSSFHLEVKITPKSGKARSYKVGHPDYKRPGVLEYRIKRVFFSPDEKGLVFVIERDELDGSGNNIRYMVETLRW
jgi:predicted secreted protein